MIKLYSSYPYLALSLVLLVLYIPCFLAGKKQRWPMLLSALLSAPYGFLSVFFVPAYWQPVRIAEWGGAGIEDIIFSFANGGVVWFMAAWPVRNRLAIDIQVKRMLLRYLLFSISGISVAYLLGLFGFSPMKGTLLAIVIIAMILLWLQRKLWPLAVIGGICFGLTYTIICTVMFALNTDFLLQWNLKALSGNYFLGVPLEEIEWSIAFGATWPLFIAYCFNARSKSLKNRTGEKLP